MEELDELFERLKLLIAASPVGDNAMIVLVDEASGDTLLYAKGVSAEALRWMLGVTRKSEDMKHKIETHQRAENN